MNGEKSYEEFIAEQDQDRGDEQSHLDSEDAIANIPVEQTISNPATDSPKPDGGLYVRDGDTLVISTDYYSISREENSRLLTPTQIGDALDLETDGEYPCSDGSITYTVNVDELLKAQRGLTASIKNTEIQELKQLNGKLRAELVNKDAECQTKIDKLFMKIKKYHRDEGGIELHSNWNGILIPEPDWLEIETQRGLVEGDESIKNTAKYYLAKVRGMIEGAGLGEKEILEAIEMPQFPKRNRYITIEYADLRLIAQAMKQAILKTIDKDEDK